MKERNMSKGILTVTRKDFEEMMSNGIDDESLLKPGTYKLRRRTKIAKPEEINSSNTKVEFQMKLDSDILKHFQNCAKNEKIEALQILLNERLRAVMEDELKIKDVENKILNDKKFIAALAEAIKEAA